MTLFHIDDSTAKPVPLRLHIPLRPRFGTAVIFPGYGYGAEAPYLYFLRMLLLERGVQVMNVDWDYPGDQDFQLMSYQEQENRIAADTLAIIRGIGRDKEIRPFTWIGKSIGATGLHQALSREPDILGDRFLFLTPGWDLRKTHFPEGFGKKAFFQLGSRDPFYLSPLWESLPEFCTKSLLDGVDHQLVAENDLQKTLAAQQQGLDDIGSFLA
jgi:hypothetical protein